MVLNLKFSHKGEIEDYVIVEDNKKLGLDVHIPNHLDHHRMEGHKRRSGQPYYSLTSADWDRFMGILSKLFNGTPPRDG
ncbi:hypothetical protein U1Q18_026687 [Sarracenia purpurea var. burkii]